MSELKAQSAKLRKKTSRVAVNEEVMRGQK